MNSINERLLEASATMRQLAVDLDAMGTDAEKRPDGYADAFRLIVLARDLGSVALRLAAAAREFGRGS